jgi:hypothetical protein
MHATCATHLILLDLVILIIFGKQYTYVAPHYTLFGQPAVISFILGPDILLSTLLGGKYVYCYRHRTSIAYILRCRF